jgi:hypothetical protein
MIYNNISLNSNYNKIVKLNKIYNINLKLLLISFNNRICINELKDLIKIALKNNIILILIIYELDINNISIFEILKFFKLIYVKDNIILNILKKDYLSYNCDLIDNMCQEKICNYSLIEKTKTNFLLNSKKYQKIYENITPYAIYFPQFHETPENNHLFYKNYTDIKGLINVKNLDTNMIYGTPNTEIFNSTNLLDYNYSENNLIIDNQITIAKNYGYCGFCIYYYWFSSNKINNNNMVFHEVINKFFTNNYDNFKIFFNWANENWSYELTNEYNKINFEKNINNLIKYFKHNNYLKIDGKPVLYIHQPWFMNLDTINLMKNIFNNICLENGFSGINLLLDNIADKITYKDYNVFGHQPFHHKNKHIGGNIVFEDGAFYLDFNDYFNYIQKNDILTDDVKTIFLSFDNYARKIYHKSIKPETELWKTKNNTFNNLNRYINHAVKFYKKDRTELNKIFLVNSWNEWGEDMAVEPSNETNLYYLELINKCLLDNILS